MTTWYQPLFAELYALQDAEKATSMRAYMKDQFPYLGIPTPLRRKISKPHLKPYLREAVDFAFCDACYADPYRELQYVAVDYLTELASKLTAADIPQIKQYILQKPWWDTIDGLDRVIGEIALREREVKELLLTWSLDENIWLRRIAIDHQLSYKNQTDTLLLEQIIVNNLHQTEFFINKAIGWSLREYSKTDAAWVRGFLERHRQGLSKLSLREAGKYL